jgi:hypothetical protein
LAKSIKEKRDITGKIVFTLWLFFSFVLFAKKKLIKSKNNNYSMPCSSIVVLGKYFRLRASKRKRDKEKKIKVTLCLLS